MRNAAPPCLGLFGRLFGHSIRPVYSYGPAQRISLDGGTANAAIRLMEATKPWKLEALSCKRCGFEPAPEPDKKLETSGEAPVVRLYRPGPL